MCPCFLLDVWQQEVNKGMTHHFRFIKWRRVIGPWSIWSPSFWLLKNDNLKNPRRNEWESYKWRLDRISLMSPAAAWDCATRCLVLCKKMSRPVQPLRIVIDRRNVWLHWISFTVRYTSQVLIETDKGEGHDLRSEVTLMRAEEPEALKPQAAS